MHPASYYRETITLNYEEQQVLLWVRAYPGITIDQFKEKQLDPDLRTHLRNIINSLYNKKYTDGDWSKGSWTCIKEMELPC